MGSDDATAANSVPGGPVRTWTLGNLYKLVLMTIMITSQKSFVNLPERYPRFEGRHIDINIVYQKSYTIIHPESTKPSSFYQGQRHAEYIDTI